MQTEPIYLDYNATTPAATEVIEAMIPWLAQPTNASSAHTFGRAAARALETARTQVADAVGSQPSRVSFTSGATEGNNLVLLGRSAPEAGRDRVLILESDHKAVLEPAFQLVDRGYRVSLIPVLPSGLIDFDWIMKALDDSVALVSIQLVNNETGVIQPVQEVAQAVHAKGGKIHTDATQALGKIAVDVQALEVDFATFSSHKLYGPQGIGAIVARRGSVLPRVFGGGQEGALRPGTENLTGAVGFGVAAQIAAGAVKPFAEQSRRQTAQFLFALRSEVDGIETTVTSETPRVGNTLSLRCHGAEGDAIVAHSPGVAFATGSACTSMVPEPSHVLTAMLRDSAAAAECIRISTGRPTTDDQVREAAHQIATAITTVRSLSM